MLLFRNIESTTKILLSHVRTLTVGLGRIVYLKEEFAQFLV